MQEHDPRFYTRYVGRYKRKDGNVTETIQYRPTKSIPIEPVLPLIEAALRMGSTHDILADRLGIPENQLWRWRTTPKLRADYNLVDEVCLELGYSLTEVYGDPDE